MRQPLVMGNWKMNGQVEMIQNLVSGIKSALGETCSAEVVVFPPAPYLFIMVDMLSDSSIQYGAQTVSEHDQGAYTGEIAADILKELHCDYALVGHSERRTLFSETNESCANKVKKALEKGLKPVLCVGESLAQREADQTFEVVGAQLEAILSVCSAEMLSGFVLAYEPVWAIGTGLAATPEQVQEVHAYLREKLMKFDERLAIQTRIVYGGSVKVENAKEIFELEDVDGGLIGGASLKADDFVQICNMS